jgi:hypothetical protein
VVDESSSYLATSPKIRDNYNENGLTLINDDESRFININILSENILKNTKISSQNTTFI